ncbi:MAG: NAD(P)-dependent oxidoreductase [Deltaproteobacteria bacterium]|nr:NAD(P)-dependent oxidoreductase [Deltaproteobacteria bacterium]
MRVGFLCLGVMGFPMAGHLAAAGHEVAVYNRTASRREEWLARNPGRALATPAEAVTGADCVLACTGNDDDLRAITLGPDGAFAAMSRDSVFVDHTTASAELARELAAHASEQGFAYLDAPVSGGQAGAENAALTVMLGGEQSDYERIVPLLDCYARKHLLLGPVGSGQLTKMVNQICIAGLLQALSEALHFAGRSGLDVARVVDVISQGAAQSWQMDNRASTMLEGRYDFGFAVDWMRKDLAIALEEAARCGADLTITALVDQLYAQIQARGDGRLDTSSLLTLLE